MNPGASAARPAQADFQELARELIEMGEVCRRFLERGRDLGALEHRISQLPRLEQNSLRLCAEGTDVPALFGDRMVELLEEYGFPRRSQIGDSAEQALWPIIETCSYRDDEVFELLMDSAVLLPADELCQIRLAFCKHLAERRGKGAPLPQAASDADVDLSSALLPTLRSPSAGPPQLAGD